MSNRVTLFGTGSGSCDNSNRNRNSGFIRLRSRISQLDFAAFQRCIWLWLAASGYKHMRSLGRHHRRGRRPASGPDFVVQLDVDYGLKIAVQVKHWKSPLTRRAVDELRGHMLRQGLSAGMIVCSSTVSNAARQAVREYPGRPVRLVGIDRLAASMAALDLGLMAWPLNQTIDESFFRLLRQISFGRALGVQAPVRHFSRQLKPTDRPHLPKPRLNSDHWIALAVIVAAGLWIWVLFGARP